MAIGVPRITTQSTKEFTITKKDFLFAVISLCAYIANIGSDLWVAVIHYQNNDIWWMKLTLIFVFASSLQFGCLWFCINEDILVALIVSIPGGMIYKLWKDLKKKWKILTEVNAQKKKSLSKEIFEELRESLFCRSFQAILTVPQLILQLYIIYNIEARLGYVGAFQWCSLFISLASFSYLVTSCDKMKLLSNGYYKISVTDTALRIAITFFTTGASFLSIALLAVFSRYALLLYIAFLIRWVVNWVEIMKILNTNYSGFCSMYDSMVPSKRDFVKDSRNKCVTDVFMLLVWYCLSTQHIPYWQRNLAVITIIGGNCVGYLCYFVWHSHFLPKRIDKEN